MRTFDLKKLKISHIFYCWKHIPINVFSVVLQGLRKIAPERNCLPVRVRVWFRISVRIRAGGQFSSGAIYLEPSFLVDMFN